MFEALRRSLLRWLLGEAPMAQIMRVQPGDTLVLHMHAYLSMTQHQRLRDTFADATGVDRVLILDGGKARLTVIRNEQAQLPAAA